MGGVGKRPKKTRSPKDLSTYPNRTKTSSVADGIYVRPNDTGGSARRRYKYIFIVLTFTAAYLVIRNTKRTLETINNDQPTKTRGETNRRRRRRRRTRSFDL